MVRQRNRNTRVKPTLAATLVSEMAQEPQRKPF